MSCTLKTLNQAASEAGNRNCEPRLNGQIQNLTSGVFLTFGTGIPGGEVRRSYVDAICDETEMALAGQGHSTSVAHSARYPGSDVIAVFSLAKARM